MLEILKTFFVSNQYQPYNNRDQASIKDAVALNNISRTIATRRLVILVTDLYKGNGYIVSSFKHSGQIYLGLSYPHKPDAIILILRVAFPQRPISYDIVRTELIKLETAGTKYNCSQYCIIAPFGFDHTAQKLKQFNLLLYDKSFLEKLSKSFSLSNIKEPQIQLFSHNQNTYENVKNKFQESKNIAVVQATGTGKSYLIAKLLSDFNGVNKLVMAPSNYIIDQLKEHIPWEKETTFMTYAKGMYVTEAEIKALNLGFIVLDEFHRCGAEEWGKGVQNILSAYSGAFVFGASATPIRYMDNSRDMSAELFNSNVAENLSLAQAIIKRILPMPKYVSALYTLDIELEIIKAKINSSQHKTKIKNNLLREVDTFRIDWEKSAGIPQVLKKHLEPEMKKFIVFCKEKDHLNEMENTVKDWFIKAGIKKQIKTYKVLHDDSESDENLSRFKNDTSFDCIHLLFSINMLNEGLHVKDVSGVILLRPTESPNIFFQQIGRCLKVGINQSPIIFDFVNNFKSIRANDFIYELDFYRNKEQRLRDEAGLQDLCPAFKIIDEIREITEVFGKINFRISDWEAKYEELSDYKKEFGTCDVQIPKDKKTIDKKKLELGIWVHYNRTRYKQQVLSQDRIQKLNAIGFTWVLNELNEWEDQFEKLIKFKDRFGHLKVTQRWKEDPTFGKWVYRQRQNYKKGTLSSEKIKKLNCIGFNLSKQIVPDQIWEAYFEDLKKYKQNFGDCNVPVYYKENGKLGRWVHGQRKNNKIGRFLTEERLAKLESIGFEWDLKYKLKDRWEKYFRALVNFKEQFGHTNVPNTNTRDNKYKPLGSWVSLQRTNYRRKKFLTPEKISQLEDIGFLWKVQDSQFYLNFNLLKSFVEATESFKVNNTSDPKYKSLKNWIGNVRKCYKNGTLSADKIKLMEDIGFKWKDPIRNLKKQKA